MAVVVLFYCNPAYPGGGWIIYSERSFKGRIIDAETKESIKGAVIVAQYHKNVFYIFDSDSFIFDVREALTDEKGEFHIPPKISLIQPLSTGGYTLFLIWKPGYKPIEKTDWFFSEEPGAMVKRRVRTNKGLEMKPVRVGIVELERAKTREERIRAIPSPPVDFGEEELSMLYKIINQEYGNLKLPGIGRNK